MRKTTASPETGRTRQGGEQRWRGRHVLQGREGRGKGGSGDQAGLTGLDWVGRRRGGGTAERPGGDNATGETVGRRSVNCRIQECQDRGTKG